MKPILISSAIALLILALASGIVVSSGIDEANTYRRLKDKRAVKLRRKRKKEFRKAKEGNYLNIGRIVPLEDEKWVLLRDAIAQVLGEPPRDFILTQQARAYHMILVGKTGTGKSYTLLDFMRQDIEKKNNALFICDPQGDLTAYIISLCKENNREYVVLPDAGYNFCAGPGLSSDRAQDLIDLFIETSGAAREGAAGYFTNMGARFIEYFFCMFEAAIGRAPTVRELQLACLKPEYRELIFQKAQGTDEAREYQIFIKDRWKEKEYDEFLSDFVNWTRKVISGKHADIYNRYDAPTIGEYLEKKAVVILCNVGRDEGHKHSVHGKLFMKSLHQFFEERPLGRHTIIVYIDEARRYFIKAIMDFLNTSRKKNGCIVLAFQYFHQFGEFGSDLHEAVRTMLINPGLSAPSAEIVQKSAGKRQFEKRSYSQSEKRGSRKSITVSTEYDYLYQDTDIMHMGENEMMVFSVNGRALEAPLKIRKPVYKRVEPEEYIPPVFSTAYPPNIYEELERTQTNRIIENELERIKKGIAPGHWLSEDD